jgi:replication factor A1
MAQQDFKSTMELILKQRPDLDAEQIKAMLDEKKRKVGAGYLTDQGALFLVAADLGISFENIPRPSAGLKDIFSGARDVTAKGRILNVYPIHTFTKRDSNEQSSTRTLVLFDRDSRIKLKLWDKQVTIPEEMGLKVGDVIKVSRGYAKAGLDGKPVLNLGSYGTIELAQDDDEIAIPSIESLTVDVSSLTAPIDVGVVSGVVSANPRISDFVNPRGEASRSLQLQLSSATAGGGDKSMRAVIWNIDESIIPRVFRTGAKLKLVGVKVKQGNPQYGNGDLEIHGDEGTILQFSSPQEEIEITPLRILSVGEETGRGSFVCLAADRGSRPFTLTIDKSLIDPSNLNPGTLVECVPSRIFGNSVILTREDAYLKIAQDDDPSFPPLSTFETKIRDIQLTPDPKPLVIHAMVLQAPDITEVNTKTGETVAVSSTLIGDDTAEIRLVGWRNQSTAISKLAVGDRIKIIGATPGAGREGKIELTFRPYSSIIHAE